MNGKKDAYKKAFDVLRALEAMHGLTGIASSFATENSSTIQMAGLDGTASSTANASTTSGSSEKIVSGDTTIGDNITTTAVPDGGGQGAKAPAKTMEHPDNSKTGNEPAVQEMEPGESANKAGDTPVQEQLSDANVSNYTILLDDNSIAY